MHKHHTRQVKTPSMSETIMTEVVYPNDANPMNMLQGGRLMQWMDTASAICAQTHAEKIAVTASIDKVAFKNPGRVGDIVYITAKITRAFKRSMEIHVTASSRKVTSMDAHPICEAYFIFVALDDNAQPAVVPEVLPETAAEKAQFKNALLRKESNGKHK